MEQSPTNNLKLVVGFIVLLILILAGYFAYISISRSGKVAVTVNAVPADATITFNGTEVSPGTIYLTPGGYEIKATKEGFDDFSNAVQITESDKTVSIPLTPASDEAKKWAEENRSEYLELEAKSGIAAQEQGKDFREKNPIVSLLPYENLLYTIGYRADPADPTGQSIIIEIDASEGYRQQAIYQISQWGYDPTDFKINFRDYQNPFTS